MKRNIIILILSAFLLVSLSGPAFAANAPWVIDHAGLLSDNQAADLNDRIQILQSDLELDIVIVTTYGTDGKDIQAFADDYYDDNGYGYGSDNSGILLLLDMEGREWYMSTCGEAIYIFTDYGLDRLGEEILPWLSSGDYYQAFLVWLDALGPYVTAFHDGNPIDDYVPPDDYTSPYGDEIYYYDDHVGTSVKPLPIALVIGLVAASVTILVMRSQMNTAKLQSSAGDYMKQGSFHLRQRSDMFLYSRVTRQARPKNNPSGGGSSVHRSSGGVSHGGRGGRF